MPDHTARRPVATALVLAMGLLIGLSACTSSSNALAPEPEPEEEAPPTSFEVAPADLPAFDTDLYKTSCQTASGDCPVVQWKNVDYVALSFRDNRSSFAIHAFDASGQLLGVREELGARYLAAVQLDIDARTVSFIGQADRTVTLEWDVLAAIR